MSRVPRPAPGCDIRSLPLKPTEAFLFSRIDAATSERDLASLTGMSLLDVTRALERLHQLGAILFEGELEPIRPRGAAAQGEERRDERPSDGGGRSSDSRTAGVVHPPQQIGRSALGAGSMSPPLYDPAELDERVEIEPDKKRRILDAYYRLEDLTYYELLGISEQADKKQVKSAYYFIAPEFHPDRFFRKSLGSYKQKIEAIFSRLTLAHDVLTNKLKRAEYDEYLEQTHKNRSMSALLEQTARDIAAVESAVEEKAQSIVSSAPSVPPSPGRYTADTRTPETLQSRRETFARKLAGGAFRPGSSSSAPPPPPSMPPPQAAAEALKARFEWARNEAKRQQIARFIEAGRSALDRKDYAAAANSYRIAATLAPEDAELQRTSAEVGQDAAIALASGFLKQANYEAGHERWHEAALSYTKAATGMPNDARVHERVALATLMSSGNARRAIDFARKAVELAPKEAEFHVTLARAYLAAGLEKSAYGELDRATELAPKDSRIRDLIKHAKETPTDKAAKA